MSWAVVGSPAGRRRCGVLATVTFTYLDTEENGRVTAHVQPVRDAPVTRAPNGPASTDAGWQALLVTQARDGDEAAFEALVRLHQDRAYRVALRMTADPHDAQDVVQDALLQAWKNLTAYRGDSGFGTWLIRIVINRCHNLRRSTRPTTALPEHDPATAAPGPETLAVAGHRRDATIAAVAALPFDQRAALVLHTFGGCTHAEVGRILGISESAAKVRVHRARHALIDQLKEWR